jgi:ribonuclease HI
MTKIFTDASFNWQDTEKSDEVVVKGKICIFYDVEKFKIVENVAIGKVPSLKQYINIFELVAICRAIEHATVLKLKDIAIVTDSSVACSWATKGKLKDSTMVTEAHTNVFEYLDRVKKEFGGIITFSHTPREFNPAGIVLDEIKNNKNV